MKKPLLICTIGHLGSGKTFIKFLDENKSVEWWYKNGDSGSEYFSISYYNQLD